MEKHHCVSIVPLFNHLSDEEQERIDSLVRHQSYKKGEMVWQPGRDPQLFIVATGALKVYQISASGREQLLRVVEPGSYEGVNALFGADTENIFVEALANTESCTLRKSDFTSLLLASPQMALKLLEINARRMADTENQTRFLMMEAVESRLATYLSDLAKASGGKVEVEIPMKLKDLAAFMGTTPETVSRKFKLLEEEEVIRRKGRKVQILDKNKLEDFL